MDDIQNQKIIENYNFNLRKFLENQKLLIDSPIFKNKERRDIVIADMYLNETKIELDSDKYKLTFITRDNKKLDNILYQEIDFMLFNKDTSIINNYNTVQNDFENSRIHIATSEKKGDFKSFVHIKEIEDESKLLNHLNEIFETHFKKEISPKKNFWEKIKDRILKYETPIDETFKLKKTGDLKDNGIVNNILYIGKILKNNNNSYENDNFKITLNQFNKSETSIDFIDKIKNNQLYILKASSSQDMGGIEHENASITILKDDGEKINMSERKASKLSFDMIVNLTKELEKNKENTLTFNKV